MKWDEFETGAQERREIVRLIFQMEQEAEVLADCDRLALERFKMLDALEAEDETNASRRGLAALSRLEFHSSGGILRGSRHQVMAPNKADCSFTPAHAP